MTSSLKEKKIAFLGFDNLSIQIMKYFTENNIKFDIISNQTKADFIKQDHIITVQNIIPNYDYYILTDYFFINKDYYSVFIAEPFLKNKLILQESILKICCDNTQLIAIVGETNEYSFYHFLNVILLKKQNTQLISNYITKEVNVDFTKEMIIFLSLNNNKIDLINSIQLDYLFLLNDDNYDDSGIEDGILKKQNVDCKTIFNIDNGTVKKLFDKHSNSEIKDDLQIKIPISAKKILDNGFSMVDGVFYNYFNSGNSHYDLSFDEKFIFGYDISISLLSCLFLIFDMFDNLEEILQLINWQQLSIKNYFQLLEHRNNIIFMSNLLNINSNSFREQLNIFSKNYCICVVNNNCDILYEEIKKNSSSIFLIIDKNSIVQQEKLMLRNYKIFNKMEDCFELLKKHFRVNEDREIAIILTTTDNVKYNSIDNIFGSYIHYFINLITEMKTIFGEDSSE